MPSQTVGEFGTPAEERPWIVVEREITIKHLTKICGAPPPEMELEIQCRNTILANTRLSF
jgi:hypothetical protein